jgi:hypothetical protein
VESILKNGIEPRIGYRSKGLEDEPVICLTEKDYIPYWRILLGLKSMAVIKLDCVPDDFNEINYTEYKEVRTKKLITPEHIELVTIKSDRTARRKAMKTLCLNRINVLSWLCQNCARLYTDGVQKTMSHREVEEFMINEYRILKRLDFSVLTLEEKRNYLKEYGESGEFTFLDTYWDTDKKLYQLSMYNDPYTYEIRHKLEDLITCIFDGCLDMCTGGWIYMQ